MVGSSSQSESEVSEQMAGLACVRSHEPHPDGFGHLPLKAQLPARRWCMRGGGHNVPGRSKILCGLPPKPPRSHPEATLRPSGSQPVGTRKPPWSHPEATLRLP